MEPQSAVRNLRGPAASRGPPLRGKRWKPVEAKIAVFRRLLDFYHVAFGISSINCFHVTGVKRCGVPERHAQTAQTFIFLLDVGHVDAEMRVALVKGAKGTIRDGFRGAELKEFKIAGAGAQHAALRGRARHIQDLVEQFVIVPAELVPNDLESECFLVKLHHPIKIADMNRYMMNSSYHSDFLSFLWYRVKMNELVK
ncbi:MAG: hypothetical protein WCE20_19310 [Rhizomicrobium sp.]